MQHKKNIFHIISNTHWDREWRFPFQRNRQMLVDMMDAVLHILETEPGYRAFHLDSQSIVLKDYLEVKPQNRERIRELTGAGRLLHGPWYILPDTFQVGGENLIRNLLLGHKTSRNCGGVSKIGYSPFSWGQISQLPQIYKEFNINLVMFYRGINALDSPKAEFLWEGADGTTLLSSRFSTMPRYNFYFYIYRPVIHNEEVHDLEYDWQKGGTPFHFADRMQSGEDYFIISPHTGYYPENIVPQVKKIVEDQAGDFTTPHIIWMEGHDSSGPNRQTVDIIRDIRKQLPGLEVRHSTLEEYADCVARSVEPEKLSKVGGERRSSQNNHRCGNLFGYTTSARMYLKQANFDAERWIQYYAEPFNIFSAVMGRDIRDNYPDMAWELIIQNAAHDSIGGCSLDRIHQDMMVRYGHSVEISRGIFERSLKAMLPRLNTRGFKSAGNHSIFVTAVNATNFERHDTVEAFVDIPKTMDQGSVKITDDSGRTMETDVIARYPHQPILEQMINRPMYFDMVRYHMYLHVRNVPGFGMKAFLAEPEAAGTGAASAREKTHENILENDFLKAVVQADGSLSVMDKRNDVLYEEVAWFEDHGEAGHAWVHERMDPTVSTRNTKPEIRRSFTGNTYQEITMVHEMMLPKDLEARRQTSPEMLSNKLEMRVGLGKTDRHLNIKIKLNNVSESHRLRLMIPTGIRATHSHGEGQFDVVARSLERPDTSAWVEQPMYDYPMHHFVDVSDGQKGLAILADGLKEYEVLPDKNNTLAITLLRTFEYRINPAAPQAYPDEKGAQMPGEQEYRLALYPHAGDWQQGQVYREAFLFNYPLRLVQSGQLSGSGGAQVRMMNIEPEDLVFSTLKKPESGGHTQMVLRLYNPTKERIKGRVSFAFSLARVQSISLEEQAREALPVESGNAFRVAVPPKKIAAYLIEWRS